MKLTNKIVVMICLLTSTIAQPMKRQRPAEGNLPEEAPAAKRTNTATGDLKLKWTGAGSDDYVKIPLSVANHSETLKNLVEDIGGAPEEAIPIQITKSALESAKNCLEIIAANSDDELLKDYVSCLDPEALIELTLAANYLDIKNEQLSLLDVCKDALVMWNKNVAKNWTLTPAIKSALYTLLDDISMPLCLRYRQEFGIDTWLLELQTKTLFEDKTEYTSIPGICFSSDGELLASAHNHKFIKLWQLVNGSWTCTETLNEKQAKHVCFSPDKKILASGSWNHFTNIKLWQSVNGKWENFATLGHACTISSLCFSPDGKTLASGDNYGTIKLWQIENGEWTCVKVLEKGSNKITSLRFSPDGTMLVAGLYWKIIVLKFDDGEWKNNTDLDSRYPDVKHNENNRTYDCYNVQGLCFSPGGTTLASGDYVGTIKIWKLVNGSWQYDTKFNTYSSKKKWESVNSVCFSPDETILASGFSDGTVMLWQLMNGEWECVKRLSHNDGWVSLCFSPNGMLASATTDLQLLDFRLMNMQKQGLRFEHLMLLKQIKDAYQAQNVFDLNDQKNKQWQEVFETLPEELKNVLIARKLVMYEFKQQKSVKADQESLFKRIKDAGKAQEALDLNEQDNEQWKEIFETLPEATKSFLIANDFVKYPLKRQRPEAADLAEEPTKKRLRVGHEELQVPSEPTLKLKWIGAGKDEYVKMPLSVANHSVTLKNKLQNLPSFPAEAMLIPLSQSALLSITNCLEIIAAQPDNELLTESLSGLEQNALGELLLAATYLGIAQVVAICSEELAKLG